MISKLVWTGLNGVKCNGGLKGEWNRMKIAPERRRWRVHLFNLFFRLVAANDVVEQHLLWLLLTAQSQDHTHLPRHADVRNAEILKKLCDKNHGYVEMMKRQ